MERVRSLVATVPTLSWTFAVKVNELAEPGVPLNVPVPPRPTPAGSVPARRLHVYGVAPPAATSPCEYGRPAYPGGSELVVMARPVQMETAKAREAVRPFWSATWIVRLTLWAVVGVPASVEPVSEIPAGSAPELME